MLPRCDFCPLSEQKSHRGGAAPAIHYRVAFYRHADPDRLALAGRDLR